MSVELAIDVLDSAGNKLGAGPIVTASSWQFRATMSASGWFTFVMPASDPASRHVRRKRVVQATASLNGQRVTVGAGVIDVVERQPTTNGEVSLRVKGYDMLRELTYRTVQGLRLFDDGEPVSQAAALAALAPYAPPGWTFLPDPNAARMVYGHYNGNTILDTLISIAQKSDSHFVGGMDRVVRFGNAFTTSGIRAVRADGDLEPELCAIRSLTEVDETYDLLTRIYPRGSGNADAQLTLRSTTRTPPPGYVLNKAENYVENVAAAQSYGRIERQLDFRDIGPIENTDADIQSASNVLFDSAVETLRRQSDALEKPTYKLEVDDCSKLLAPMQSMRIVYQDLEAELDIDDELNILATTWQVNDTGVKTTHITVSHADRLPISGTDILVGNMEQSMVYQAMPQLNANSYTTAYKALVDGDTTATINFDLGSEVTQVNQILLRFQLEPFESTVKAVGGASSGSGQLITAGPSVNTSGQPGNNTSGTPSTNTSGESSGSTGAASGSTEGPSNNVSGTPSVSDTGAASGSTAAASGSTAPPGINNSGPPSSDASGLPSVNVGGGPSTNTSGEPSSLNSGGPSVANSGGPSETNSGGPSVGSTAAPNINVSAPPNVNASGAPSSNSSGPSGMLTTGNPFGGEIEPDGRHVHNIVVADFHPAAGIPVYAYGFGSDTILGAQFGNGPRTAYTQSSGVHAHNVGSHTHDLNSHTHDLGLHTHSLGGHTHTLNDHTHSMAGHTHSLSNHSHSLSNHTHSLNNHTHSLNNHTHSLGGHTHGMNNHTHSLNDHTHGLGNHTHGLGSHTHNLGGHTHTLGNHTHGLGNHTHTLGNHTHSLNSHTHSLNNHVHNLSESISAVYGIFRESVANTYQIGDLEYQVNYGDWMPLNTAVNLDGQRWQLDLTMAVVNPATLRPAMENNRVHFRRRGTAPNNKTVAIDCQLKVRNVIQAVALVN